MPTTESRWETGAIIPKYRITTAPVRAMVEATTSGTGWSVFPGRELFGESLNPTGQGAFEAVGGVAMNDVVAAGLVSSGSKCFERFQGGIGISGKDRSVHFLAAGPDVGLDDAVALRADTGLTDAFESGFGVGHDRLGGFP